MARGAERRAGARALLTSSTVVALLASQLAMTSPVAADDVLGLSVLTVRDRQVQIEVCLGSGARLPAQVSLAYTVSSSGTSCPFDE